MDLSRDLCVNAQLSLLPKSAYKRLLHATELLHIEELLGALLLDRLPYEDQPTTVQECLDQLRHWPNPDTCSLICISPVLHFHGKLCAPIGEVFDRLTTLIPNIYDILTEPVIHELANRISPESGCQVDQEFTVYNMNFPSKNVVVLFWPNITLVTKSNRELLFRRWTTLRENLNQNFQLIMPYPDPLAKFWDLFLLRQLEQTDIVVVGPTTALFRNYASLKEPHSVSNRQNDWSAEQIECAFLLDLLRGRFNRSGLLETNLVYQRSGKLPPVVLALAELDCDEAYQMSGFVYRLPKEIEILLKYVYEIHKTCNLSGREIKK